MAQQISKNPSRLLTHLFAWALSNACFCISDTPLLQKAKQENVSEKGPKIRTPVEESGQERRDSADAGKLKPQTRNKNTSAEERNHEVSAVKQKYDVIICH